MEIDKKLLETLLALKKKDPEAYRKQLRELTVKLEDKVKAGVELTKAERIVYETGKGIEKKPPIPKEEIPTKELIDAIEKLGRELKETDRDILEAIKRMTVAAVAPPIEKKPIVTELGVFNIKYGLYYFIEPCPRHIEEEVEKELEKHEWKKYLETFKGKEREKEKEKVKEELRDMIRADITAYPDITLVERFPIVERWLEIHPEYFMAPASAKLFFPLCPYHRSVSGRPTWEYPRDQVESWIGMVASGIDEWGERRFVPVAPEEFLAGGITMEYINHAIKTFGDKVKTLEELRREKEKEREESFT